MATCMNLISGAAESGVSDTGVWGARTPKSCYFRTTGSRKIQLFTQEAVKYDLFHIICRLHPYHLGFNPLTGTRMDRI